MKDIRMTYTDTDIFLSTYILTFFRMAGIYVYERVECKDAQTQKLMRYPEASFDIEIFILNDSDSKFEIPPDAIVISMGKKESGRLNRNYDIIYLEANDSPEKCMKKLLEHLCESYDQFGMEKACLLNLLNLYDKNHIMETILGTRFFAPDQDIYREVCVNYRRAVQKIYELNCDESKFLMFAYVYLAYEYNYYCKRLNEVFLYDVNSILDILNDLASGSDEQWNDLDLLYAQVYDDLLGKYREASEYYAKAAEKGYNAFACYKMGNIWKGEYRDPITALKYFTKAVDINPNYYRAIYKMAECYVSLQNIEEAERQYMRIVQILQARRYKQILRPMEIEYLYKTYKNLAKIERNDHNNINGAISYYENAEYLWNQICDNQDSYDFCSGFKNVIRKANSDIINKQYELLKDKLKISQIYDNLCTLYSQISNHEKAKIYEELLKKEG